MALDHNVKFRILGVALAGFLFAFAGTAQAQCRVGSGPEQGDGIPWCNQPAPAQPASPAAPPGKPEWMSFSAAIAWGEEGKRDVFTAVDQYFDEQAARDAVLKSCQQKGWKNCTVARSVTNGAIAVGRDETGALRLRVETTVRDARTKLLERCAADSVRCKVEQVLNAEPRRF